MLYLEDYLEMIEHLPQELRDRFTEIRELDLAVQNNMDSLEKKARVLFHQCKRGELQEAAIDSEFGNLRKEYYKILEDADEKVTLATQIHELVERYLRRLDSELFKFKCELEADNNGITEILEKRSLEMDSGSSAATALMNVIAINQKENHYYSPMNSSTNSSSSSMIGPIGASTASGVGLIPSTPSGSTKDNRYRVPKTEKRRDSNPSTLPTVPEKRQNFSNNLTVPTPQALSVVRPITPNLSGHAAVMNSPTTAINTVGGTNSVAYNLQQLGGPASNAIAAAASKAIVDTQQMQQGRRTASLKASYEAIHGSGGGPTEFWISRDIANVATSTVQNPMQTMSGEKKQKKKLNTSLSHGLVTGGGPGGPPTSAPPFIATSPSLSADSLDITSPCPSVSNSIITPALSLNASAVAPMSGANVGRSSLAGSSSTSSSTLMAPSPSLTLNENGLVVEQTPDGESWSYDPNEPRYCTCNQVSYGDMVACDNDACPYEWFHYPCVGITQPPKGKWYCPKCTASMRRRGNRKN